MRAWSNGPSTSSADRRYLRGAAWMASAGSWAWAGAGWGVRGGEGGRLEVLGVGGGA